MFAPVGDDKGGGCFFYPQVIFCISLCSYKKNHTAVNHIEPLRGSFFVSDARTERPYYYYALTLFADARTERPYYHYTLTLFADARTERPYYYYALYFLRTLEPSVHTHYLLNFQFGLNLSTTFAPSRITTPGFDRTMVLS